MGNDRAWKGRPTIEAEDIMLVSAIDADEGAHILHHTKNRHTDFLEEVNASNSVSESEILRRRYNDGACPSQHGGLRYYSGISPSSSRLCVIVSCTSPVPGGKSKTNRSSLGHDTSNIS